jgi:type I phosphodiesterase/nucleotide pyrophosphatase
LVSADDFFLLIQRGLDRGIRRLRLGHPPSADRCRLLIVQIDGLSLSVLEQALAAGRMPFLRRLLARGRYRLVPMTVGMPTSTPAFQLALMYGVRPDIPAFHYYDKRRRADVYFPRAGDAALVEASQAAGRSGILEDGSAYGCVFTGGAAQSLFNFARMRRPVAEGLLRTVSAVVVLAWVIVKATAVTGFTLGRSLIGILADPLRRRAGGWRWLAIKLGISVWLRQLFTLAVSRDLYAGVPAVYVNYLDYDIYAHAWGPRHRAALRALGRIDRSLRQIWRIIRRVPEYRYDLFILSDHGQAACEPFTRLSAGRPFERFLLEEGFDPARGASARLRSPGLRKGIAGLRRGRASGLFQRFVNYLEADFPWLLGGVKGVSQQGAVRVIAAGPNALVYWVDVAEPLGMEKIEDRAPGLAEALSRLPGVGFILARSAGGPVCWWRGTCVTLSAQHPGPFAGRADLELVLAGIADLMAMPSAGDLVLYGLGAPEGNVSYVAELGAHAGPSVDELHTFIVHPQRVSLPSPITHPLDLYPCFRRYRDAQ